MYAAFINENKIEKAPEIITVGQYRVINPKQEDYREAGYFEVRDEIPSESPRKWYHYKKQYELVLGEESYIRGFYIEEKDTCPVYANEVTRLIRQRYSQNDVEAIILNGTDTVEHSEEFEALQVFRAQIKANVKADIAEWEQA